MCLAVPGQIIDSPDSSDVERTGRVSFGGVVKEVSLAFTPEARIGDYVIVHAGFAISRLDEQEARAALAEFEALKALDLDEAGSP
jgi:hydrogenase expression/formation protein HypC